MKNNSPFNSLFSFLLCDDILKENFKTEFDFEVKIGRYTLLTDSRTPVNRALDVNREIVIFGYAVDVFSGCIDSLAETVLSETKVLDDVIEREKKLGGKYVIFYRENGKVYCLGDATCSVPIFYSIALK